MLKYVTNNFHPELNKINISLRLPSLVDSEEMEVFEVDVQSIASTKDEKSNNNVSDILTQ